MANVVAIIGHAGQLTGEATIEGLWRDLALAGEAATPPAPAGEAATLPAPAGGATTPPAGTGEATTLPAPAGEATTLPAAAGEASHRAGVAALFRAGAAELLKGVAPADRTGLFLRSGAGGAGGAGGTGANGSPGIAGSTAGEPDVAAAVAGALGLSGPAATLHGPAFLAVERAAQSLLAAECDLALAGEAPVRGGGALVVALRRLPAALADGAPILALVDAAAVRDLAPPPPPVPHPLQDAATAEGPATPPRERPPLAGPYNPPANPLEAAIASIWQEQLGIARVGVDDNFFELGGTSIAGVRIIALLKEWLHQSIPTVKLYEGPTVRALAELLLHSGPAPGYDQVRERGERRRRKLQRLQGLAPAAGE